MISAGALARYAWVISSTGSDVRFAQALRSGTRGRPANVNDARLYLLAGMIATDVEGQATVAAMMRALTKGISRTEQLELEVPTTAAGRKKLEARLYNIHKKITYQLNHGAWLDLEPDEATERADQLQGLIDAMLSATHLHTEDTTFAMDATGVHAWGRYAGQRALGEVDDAERDGAEEIQGEGEPADPQAHDDAAEVVERRRTTRAGSYDPEAALGYKTSKSGKAETFFGYHVHALSRVCRTVNDTRLAPLAVQSFTVTPANADVVEPSLALLDRVTDAGITIGELGVDRHYSYKTWDRWRLQLRRRGIKPIHDLRRTDHGFTHYNGMKIAAGWPHCPATPPDLAEIPRPGFAATQEEWQQFHERIEQRRAYALRRINDHDHNGRTRWQCPALAGTCGCTLRPDTVTAAQEASRAAAERGEPVLIPIITNGAEHQPDGDMWKPCTAQTASIADGPHMKMYQQHYWGSVEWETEWSLRTFIEGWFGVVKNPTVAGMDRHFYRGVGTAHVSIAVLFAAVVTNIHLLRKWHSETGLGPAEHPLLQVDDEDHGFERLDADRAAHLDRAHHLGQLVRAHKVAA